MKSLPMILTLTLLLTSVAWGQETYVGTLTGTNINVRSQATTASYAAMQVSRPGTVTVVGSNADGTWLKIVPPAGSYSVVPFAAVDITAGTGGTSGTINRNGVSVRAGTNQNDFTQLAQFTSIQMQLNRGARVKIVGTGADFYKITPPDGAYLWITSQYVAAPGQEAPAPQPQPQPQPVAPAPQPTPTETIDPELKAAFDALEQRLRDEVTNKEPMDRNLEGLLAEYKALDTSEGGQFASVVNSRITALERAIEIQRELTAVEAEIDSSQRERAELARQREALARGDSPDEPRRFDAQGLLNASQAFAPGGAVPERFILRDADTGLIIAYLEASRSTQDLSRHAGALVGVFGESRMDAELGKVIRVEQVVVIDDNAQDTMTAPLQPEVDTEPIDIDTTPVVDSPVVGEPEIEPEALPDYPEDTPTVTPVDDEHPEVPDEPQAPAVLVDDPAADVPQAPEAPSIDDLPQIDVDEDVDVEETPTVRPEDTSSPAEEPDDQPEFTTPLPPSEMPVVPIDDKDDFELDTSEWD
jgi:hypothetical protein